MGKTTTAKRLAKSIQRIDIPAEAGAFRFDPDGALKAVEEPVLLDEWQEVPELMGAVRRAVDKGALSVLKAFERAPQLRTWLAMY